MRQESKRTCDLDRFFLVLSGWIALSMAPTAAAEAQFARPVKGHFLGHRKCCGVLACDAEYTDLELHVVGYGEPSASVCLCLSLSLSLSVSLSIFSHPDSEAMHLYCR